MNPHPLPRRLLAATLLSVAVLAAAGCSSDSSDDDRKSTQESAQVAELSAGASVTDRLEAAVRRTLNTGPLRVTTAGDGYTTESQLDYEQKITFAERRTAGSADPVHSVLMRDNVVLVRLAEDSDGTVGGVWYRMPDDGQVLQMLNASFDVEWVSDLILSAKDVTDAGTEQVNGADATHIVVTPDAEALLDQTIQALPENMRPTRPEARAAMLQQVPAAMHYWVDGDGFLVKEDDGSEVKTYSAFGEPLELPDVDAASAPLMPVD